MDEVSEFYPGSHREQRTWNPNRVTREGGLLIITVSSVHEGEGSTSQVSGNLCLSTYPSDCPRGAQTVAMWGPQTWSYEKNTLPSSSTGFMVSHDYPTSRSSSPTIGSVKFQWARGNFYHQVPPTSLLYPKRSHRPHPSPHSPPSYVSLSSTPRVSLLDSNPLESFGVERPGSGT